MPKQLINLIGILVSVAVLAIGIFLLALPLVTQSFATDAQTQQVSQTNKLYQAQVDSLTKAQQNKDQTAAAVAELRTQIPATPKLQGVFDLVGSASVSSGVTITSVTAGTPAAFVARTDAATLGEQKSTPAPAPSPSPTATAGGPVGQAQQVAGEANAQTAQTNAALGTGGAAGSTAAGSTRTQIDFAITVTGKDINQITAFLDALRAGPRLLSNITSTVSASGNGLQASVTALTFVDGAPVATTGGAK